MGGTGEGAVRDPRSGTVGDADVTVHEELRVVTEELEVQQHRVDALLDDLADQRRWRQRITSTLPVPVYVTDERGVLVDVNAAAAVQVDISHDVLVGETLSSLVHEADRPRLAGLWTRADGRDITVRLRLDTPGGPAPVLLLGVPDGATGDGTADGPSSPTWFFLAQPDDGGSARTATPGAMPVARALSALARLTLSQGPDARSLLSAATGIVRDAVDGADGVSLTVGPPEQPDVQAADSAFAQTVDGIELQHAQGPCVDAYRDGETVLSDDVTADARWPAIHEAAQRAGLGAALAHPLQGTTGVAGVLNVYARRPGGLAPADVEPVRLLASAFAALLAGVDERRHLQEAGDQLRTALVSRASIDQAKGMVMGAHGGGPDEAFARLVAASRRRNIKLRELAEAVVDRTEPVADL